MASWPVSALVGGVLTSRVSLAAPLIIGAGMKRKGETQEKGEQGEKKVSLDSVPAAARDALLREAGGAPILSVEEEQENGANVYEASVRQRNEVIGISVDANGKLVSKHSESAEHE